VVLLLTGSLVGAERRENRCCEVTSAARIRAAVEGGGRRDFPGRLKGRSGVGAMDISHVYIDLIS